VMCTICTNRSNATRKQVQMLESAACVHITHRVVEIHRLKWEEKRICLFFSFKETKDWYRVTNGVPFSPVNMSRRKKQFNDKSW